MDAEVAKMMNGVLARGAVHGAGLTELADRNLTQGLGVINSALIHQNGAVSDDAGLIAALQTASRAPVQGANPFPGGGA